MKNQSESNAAAWTCARRWLVPVSCLATGFAALAIDLPWARWLATGPLPSWLHKLILLSEAFAHASGVSIILLTVAVLDVRNRRALPRLLGASLGAGIVADAMKLLIARSRPQAFPISDLSKSVRDTFGDWLPGFRGGNAVQGFPSAHIAVAAGLAFGLTRLYPRGRWLWCCLVILAAGQRWLEQAHFLSDTLWGAAVGLTVSRLCFAGWRPAQLLQPPKLCAPADADQQPMRKAG